MATGKAMHNFSAAKIHCHKSVCKSNGLGFINQVNINGLNNFILF
jgi:hypothetical protein